MKNWFNIISSVKLPTKVAVKPAPGEIKVLELQLDMLRDKKKFIPRQIDQMRRELSDITEQITSLERQLNHLRSQK